MTAPRLRLAHWASGAPTVLVWIETLGAVVLASGGSPAPGSQTNHTFVTGEISDDDALELLARHGVPGRRELASLTDEDPGQVDVAWDLAELLRKCLYDYGLTRLSPGRQHSFSLQLVYDYAPNRAGYCRRDTDCVGSDEDHLWVMARPAGITPPFLIWHVNLRTGAVVPPTPLRVS